ncbi:MAG TPA: PDZ domain-containing protein [Pirellulaceae bacterium]|nr:PDZ domain-containing protein [Pirellulaceae bacterium]
MKGMSPAFVALWSLALGLATVRHCRADDFKPPWPDHVRHVTFALPSAGSPILIPVTAGNRGLVFIVDTTMPCSLIHERHREWLESIPADDADGTEHGTKWYKFPSLLARGLPLPVADRVAAADLAGYEDILGTRIDGVFGADILRKLVLYIDNDRDQGAIALGDAAPFVTREESLPVKYDRLGVPMISVKPGDFSDHFYVDMAAWHSATFTSDLTDKLLAGRALRLNDTFRFMRNRYGDEEIRIDLRCTQMSVGNTQLRDVVCYRDDRNVVAYGILSRFRITLVLPEDRIVLSPASGLTAADHTDKDGIDFVKASWGNEVVLVAGEMLGKRAGLQVGDVFLKIDGVDVVARSRDDICRRLFLERTSPTTMTVRRGEQEVEVVLPK